MARVQQATYFTRVGGAIRGLWRRAVFLWIASIAAAAVLRGDSGTDLSTLTSSHAVHSLSAADARRRHPVRIRGWVAYYDPYLDPTLTCMFLHDTSGDIFVSLPSRLILPLRQGTPVEVTGWSGAGEFAPIVSEGQVRMLGGRIRKMDAPTVILPLLIAGGYDAMFAQVEGVVQGVVESDHNAVLKLSTGTGVVRATTPREPDIDYARLIDAQVRIRGNIGPQFNHRRQVTGAHLFFQSMTDVSVMRESRSDPFSGPLRAVNDLTQIASGLGVLNGVHIRGRATLQWPGRFLCLEDASGGLCVESSQQDRVSVGEWVDVVGFPSVEDSTTGLVEARFRRSGSIKPVEPAKTTPADLLRGRYAGKLVTIEGKLIGMDEYPDSEVKDWTLTMESGGRLFRVLLPGGLRRLDWQIPEKGSVLRLTGVCLPEIDPHHEEVAERQSGYDSFRLLLRSPSDVTVVTVPPWWSGPRLKYGLLAITWTAILGGVWVIVLRRRVRHQTRVIRESEERFRHLAEHDGLTGLANRRLLNDRLQASLDEVRSVGGCMAVLMMDLDKFKQVNDGFGHHVGDRMLCAAAERIAGSVRPGDTVARTGGDEFVVLLRTLNDGREAEAIAAKIVAAISAPLEVDGQIIPMSASIGICAYPLGGGDLETLLRNCDTSLYGAKALGRNCWQSFESLDLPPAATQKLTVPC